MSVVSYVRFNFVKHLQIETLSKVKPHKQHALLPNGPASPHPLGVAIQFSFIFVLFLHCSVVKQIKLARRRLNWTLRSIYGELIVYMFLSFIAVLFVVPFSFFPWHSVLVGLIERDEGADKIFMGHFLCRHNAATSAIFCSKLTGIIEKRLYCLIQQPIR